MGDFLIIMNFFKKWKGYLTERLPKIVLILLIIQPCLDVLSFGMTKLGTTIFSTLIRFLMLAVVGLLGFLVTDKKKAYLIIYGVMAGFWVLHAANEFRIGYVSFYEDTANYLRILTLPVFLFTFLTFFEKKGEEVRKVIGIGFAVNMGLSALFTALPWGLSLLGLGEPVYTYDKLYLGFMGWFAVPNAQSCILVLLAPLTMFLAYRTKKLWFFALACFVSIFMLFITGTKLTYYSIFLIPAGFFVLFLLNSGRRKALPFAGILIAVLAVAVVFRQYAPMQIRESMSSYSQGLLGDLVEESLSEAGADEEVRKAIEEGLEEEETDFEAARKLLKVRRSLMGIYTADELYGEILKDVNDRFGLYNVMEAYHHSAHTGVLSDLRLRRTNYAKLMWQECDIPTKLLGFEYSAMIHNGTIYDMENDFPSIYYNCGLIGLLLYLSLFLYIAAAAVKGFLRDPLHYLTVELGAVGMTVVLALAAAQISGYVFRRPNVAIYLAAASSYLCYLSRNVQAPEENPWKKLWQLIKKWGKAPFRRRKKENPV